ncbi:MAG: GH92 family glycosyl hydrolase, partial [Candidatus Hadarchaeales archaeon]
NQRSPIFRWIAGKNAENHRFVIDDSPDFSSPIEENLVPMPRENYTMVAQLGEGRYYWKVATVSGIYENWSEPWTFFVDLTPPLSFGLLSPPDGSTLSTATPTLQWQSSGDNSGLAFYEVWIDEQLAGQTDKTNFTPTEALTEGLHRWRIVAVDVAGNRTSSTTFSFMVRITRLIEYVNPLIGSIYGRTQPGPNLPFAMTGWHPARKEEASTIEFPYEYGMTAIAGFRASHFPSGSCMKDYACVTIMPITGTLKLGAERASKYSGEMSRPGYYSVHLDDYGIKAELTSTMRCGILRFNFEREGEAHIVIDAHRGQGWVQVLPDRREVVGYNVNVGQYYYKGINGYFVFKFDRDFTSYGTWLNAGQETHPGQATIQGYHAGCWVTFNVGAGDNILVRGGTSFISLDQARYNLQVEVGGKGFEEVRGEAENIWENALSKIEIEGTREQKIKFYSALYHSLLVPRVVSEYGKYWSPFDGKVHELPAGHEFYTDYSMWDIFRSEWALLILLFPERVADMVQSLVYMYEQGGWIPKWPNPAYSSIMIGTHSDSLIAEAYLKGVRGFDVQKAYEGMLKHATQVPPAFYEARTGITDYMSLGYCPADKGYPESLSLTLEYAYDDWCIAQLAKALGKENDYRYFTGRSLYYRNVFDNSVGFMRGRNSDGRWAETSFDPTSFYGWMCQPNEGDPYQYTWFVPHDIWGLRQLLDGSENNPNYPGGFLTKLETLFERSEEPRLIAENKYAEHGTVRYYWHGNEPGQHIAYMFNYAGRPWRTQYWVDHILKTRYRLFAYGLPGNDDGGQLSSWYVMSSLGFYPVAPPDLAYNIGRPLHPLARIHLPNGRTFTILAENVSEENMYVQWVMLNGRPLTRPWFRHEKLVEGGQLVLTMGPNPNTAWGSHPSHSPPSLSGPRFKFENFRLSPLSVAENENLHISVDILNEGDHSGTLLVELVLDNSLVDNREVELVPGRSASVSFSIIATGPGLHWVGIANEEVGSHFAVMEAGAQFAVENLTIQPTVAMPGENVHISVSVANIGV